MILQLIRKPGEVVEPRCRLVLEAPRGLGAGQDAVRPYRPEDRLRPFLAVIYPPEAEAAVLKEWKTLQALSEPGSTSAPWTFWRSRSAVIENLGVENVVNVLTDPMPGASPEAELISMWSSALAARVKELATGRGQGRPVVVLERLAALYPATGPRAVMQGLWDSEQDALEGPVIVLIPGTLIEARVYRFLDLSEEFMYRGDIL